MSYILDSIKKSDQERGSSPIDPPEHFRTPAYLKAPEAKKDYTLWVYGFFGVVIFAMLAYLIVVSLPQSNLQESSLVTAPATQSQTPVAGIGEQSDPRLSDEIAVNPEQTAIATEPFAGEPVEEAIALGTNNQAIESLYETREQQSTVASISNTTNNSGDIPTQYNEINAVNNYVNTSAEVDEPAVVSIPSVFSFDPATQRTIPDVQYGAHIYASDNNSGFVILNGAKKQVGDQLRNGIYVEKINVEEVVLSYNGLLFSLPALKSWSYNSSP